MTHALCKEGLNSFVKNFVPCQPAQFAQADMGRNFPLFLIFSARQSTNIPYVSVECFTK